MMGRDEAARALAGALRAAADALEVLMGPAQEGQAPARVDWSTRYLSVQQVAERLAVSENHIRNLTRSGALPSVRIGGVLRIHELALEEYLELGRVERQSEADFRAVSEYLREMN